MTLRPSDSYQLVCRAALDLPRELVDRHVELLALGAAGLTALPEIRGWIDEVTTRYGLAAAIVSPGDLLDTVIDRLRVAAAARLATAGAASADVYSALWPDPECRRGPRFDVAAPVERHPIWHALRPEVDRRIAVGDLDDLLELYSDERAYLARLQPAPPFWDYYTHLSRRGTLLQDDFSEMLWFAESVDFAWMDSSLLPSLPPAVIHAFIEWHHDEPARLIQLLGNPSPAVVSAALHQLSAALGTHAGGRRDAHDVRDRLAHGTPGAEDELAALCVRDEAVRRELKERLAQVTVQLAPHTEALADLFVTAASDVRHGRPLRETLTAILSLLPGTRLQALADQAIASVRAGDRRAAELLLDVAVVAGSAALYARVSEGCLDAWLAIPLAERSAIGWSVNLLANGYVRAFQTSPAPKLLELGQLRDEALLRVTGRYTEGQFELVDDIALRSLSVVHLCQLGAEGFPRSERGAQERWLCRLLGDAPAFVTDLVGALARKILATTSPSEPDELAGAVALLSAAVRSSGFTDDWGDWLPADPDLRTRILTAAHPSALHDVAPFVLGVARAKPDLVALIAAYLSLDCVICADLALAKLGALKGPPAELARALTTVADVAKVHPRLAEVLSWPLANPHLRWLRSGLISATRRLAPIVDVDRIVADHAWVFILEEREFLDSSQIWAPQQR